jgi:hypothetical protein
LKTENETNYFWTLTFFAKQDKEAGEMPNVKSNWTDPCWDKSFWQMVNLRSSNSKWYSIQNSPLPLNNGKNIHI